MRLTSSASAAAASIACALPALPASGREVEQGAELLGTVNFANSCDAKVQQELRRGIATPHSFWYSAGETACCRVLAGDPGCSIATFGIAALLMNNPLAGQGASPEAAEAALSALEQGCSSAPQDVARTR